MHAVVTVHGVRHHRRHRGFGVIGASACAMIVRDLSLIGYGLAARRVAMLRPRRFAGSW